MLERAVWDDKFSTGDGDVDFQHKYLLDTFNLLGDVIEGGSEKKGIQLILGRLRFYSEWHFVKEEGCMDFHRCPVGAANKKAHAAFIRMLDEYLIDIEKNENGFQGLATIIHLDLLEWMKSHILRVDTQLLDCIRGKN